MGQVRQLVTAGEFKDGDNGSDIDSNLLFGKPSTPLVDTGLLETPTANGTHERVRISTQEENSALRSSDNIKFSNSKAPHSTGLATSNIPSTSESRLCDKSVSHLAAPHLADIQQNQPPRLDDETTSPEYRMSRLAEESIQNGVPHGFLGAPNQNGVSHENLGAHSQNIVPHGYLGAPSNTARSVLFRPDTSNPDEILRVDSCIDLSTSGN